MKNCSCYTISLESIIFLSILITDMSYRVFSKNFVDFATLAITHFRYCSIPSHIYIKILYIFNRVHPGIKGIKATEAQEVTRCGRVGSRNIPKE